MTGLLARIADGFNRLPIWRGVHPVWGFRISSATFDRWLYLFLHRLGFMGRAERRALEKTIRPGQIIVDVGANLGLYTVLLSRLVGPAGRVISFEPDPALFNLLQACCARNACHNVTAYNLALGSQPGRMAMRRLILNSGDNTLGREGSGLFRETISIEVARLDDLIPGLRPDVVKIDVQGWEFEALRGMARILADNPQLEIHFEYWPAGLRRAGASPEALTDWLGSLGYRFRLAGGTTGLDAAALAVLTRELTGLKHADLVAFRPGANANGEIAGNLGSRPAPDGTPK